MKEFWNHNKYFITTFIYSFVGIMIVEILFKKMAFNSIFDLELIQITLFTIVTALFMSLCLTFIPRKANRIIILVVTFMIATYAMVQLGFKAFQGNYMSLSMAGGEGGGRPGSMIGDFIQYLKPVFFTCYLSVIIIGVFMFFIEDKKINKSKFNYRQFIIGVSLLILTHISSLTVLKADAFQGKDQVLTNYELYKKTSFQEIALREFGALRFVYRDFIYMISPNEDNSLEDVIIIVPEEPTEPVIPDYERVIDDTKWDELIANENDETIKMLHNFYKNQSVTSKNEYTGMFKDKNLVLIMVEAFDMTAINPEITPTLYRLANEGWYFDNYYTPKYSCTTGESEFIGLTSIIPSATQCTPNAYKNNSYPTSIFSLFNKSDYYSTSYHNYTDKYYERKTLHKNMGSLKFYNRDDLTNIKPVWGWPSDELLMQESLPYFIDQDKFFSFIITSTMHFPYDSDSLVVRENWDRVKHLDKPDKIKRYMAKAIELDEALALLIKTLEEKGKLEDTVIAIFGDHHPLKMEYNYLNESSSIDRMKDFNIDRLPFIIYNSEVESKTISTVSSTFDILPTLANLFDLDYDPRYYVGTDIFSEEEKIVIFNNGSWITDKGMYKSTKGTFTATADDIPEGYSQKIGKIVKDWFNVSDQTLRKNYFKHRFEDD